MFAFKSTLAVGVLMLALAPAASAKEAIGRIKTLSSNDPVLVENATQKRYAVLNGAVYEGDKILTSNKQSVGIVFIDGAILTLGPRSQFEVTDFTFEPAARDVMFKSKVAKGVVSFISGAISRINPEKVTIETPTTVLGLRGTKILVEVR